MFMANPQIEQSCTLIYLRHSIFFELLVGNARLPDGNACFARQRLDPAGTIAADTGHDEMVPGIAT